MLTAIILTLFAIVHTATELVELVPALNAIVAATDALAAKLAKNGVTGVETTLKDQLTANPDFNGAAFCFNPDVKGSCLFAYRTTAGKAETVDIAEDI
jgi:hypothetical protein